MGVPPVNHAQDARATIKLTHYALLILRCSGSNFKKVNLDRVRRREKRNDQPGTGTGFETGVMQSCDRVIEI